MKYLVYERTAHQWHYTVGELSGTAQLYIHYGANILHKFIDEEHQIYGGGWINLNEAKRDFKNKIKELQQ